jgi:hypothetical protein
MAANLTNTPDNDPEGRLARFQAIIEQLEPDALLFLLRYAIDLQSGRLVAVGDGTVVVTRAWAPLTAEQSENYKLWNSVLGLGPKGDAR